MKIYGLIGSSLKHSFSENYFNTLFAREKITGCIYKNFELRDAAEVMPLIAANPELCGLNVTIPFKQSVMPYLHELDASANAGAVNTIVIKRSGQTIALKGYNTDVVGFLKAISPYLNPERKRALILGTGGAAAAVKFAFMQAGIAVTDVSREKRNNAITYGDISRKIMAEHLIVVNCTPAGMFPNADTFPSLPYEFFTPLHLAFDLVYNPPVTQFMKRAAAFGAETVNGLEMLYRQADASWMIWNQQ